jgi:hypothetical protein
MELQRERRGYFGLFEGTRISKEAVFGVDGRVSLRVRGGCMDLWNLGDGVGWDLEYSLSLSIYNVFFV